MPDQIIIGNYTKGLRTDRLPFNIDNDAFPTMINFYSWRGRARRKRGTSLLGQLQRQIQSVVTSAPPLNWQEGTIAILNGSGNAQANLLGKLTSSVTITGITQASSAVVTVSGSYTIGNRVYIDSVVGMVQINGGIYTITGTGAGTITINVNSTAFTAYSSAGSLYVQPSTQTATITPGSISLSDGTNTYIDSGTLNGTLVGTPAGTGTINYVTGAITITGGAAAGNLVGTFSYYPGIPVMGLEDFISSLSAAPYPLLLAFDTKYSYQVNQTTAIENFYNVNFYKNTNTPFSWTGTDFQQFWTTNYQNALWATNGKAGFQFESVLSFTAGNPTIITTAAPHGLITGDYVWFNEVTGADANILNGLTFSITKTGANTFTIALNSTGKAINNAGIFQTLTASSVSGDGIKWYDGDPTGGTGLPTGSGKGWVNFSPPLTATSVSINDTPSALYYLVGAVAILPFKDRLLFFGPSIQSSSGGAIYLQDVVIWSWNGTAYYNSLIPSNQTSNVSAYYVDQTGSGGWIAAGISQPIVTINNNEDVLMVGFSGRQTRFAYTGNDLNPFLFYSVNSELGSSATFSGVSLDRGAITIGDYGIALTTQQSAQRIDLQIPDSVFQIQALNSGVQRVNAIRDYYKEWIYFSYPVSNSITKFPTQTFLYNYRDDTWSILYENFTAHGTYRKQLKNTWASISRKFKTWNQWREPWNTGINSAFFPTIVAGNPQGYVLQKAQGTGEAHSGTIQAIANSSGETLITSVNHCVNAANPLTNDGDYLYIQGCLGTTSINNEIGKVTQVIDANNFVIDLPFPSGTYLGLGTYSRLSQPILQTKQFPGYWGEGRQTRLGTQKYLMDKTTNSQITVGIFLSQDPNDAWNKSAIVPSDEPNPVNNSLIYSQVLYTCPESENLGLTAPNTNLQMPTASSQFQIWHRFNTSLIGDTVQIGLTLNDEQMRNLTYATAEITLHAIQIDTYRGPLLA